MKLLFPPCATMELLGLLKMLITVLITTDKRLCYQAIREGSLMGQINGICVGDHIEKVNDVSMVGSRHFEVAKVLKEIKRGDQFSLRLVEPIKSGFSKFCPIYL